MRNQKQASRTSINDGKGPPKEEYHKGKEHSTSDEDNDSTNLSSKGRIIVEPFDNNIFKEMSLETKKSLKGLEMN